MKSLIIKKVINHCLKKFGKNYKSFSFINKNEKVNLKQMAETTDIYLIDDRCLLHYYIYQEPAKPLLCDKYYNLYDIVFEILSTEFFSDIVMASMQLTYSIDSVEDEVLKDYLIKNDVENLEYLQKTLISNEISKYYYNSLYRKLDDYTNSFLFKISDNFIFDNNKIKEDDIFGKWVLLDTIREYDEKEFKIVSKLGNGSERIERCFLLEVSNVIIMNVKSEDKLDYEERLFLSKDKNTLVVYNHYGRRVFNKINNTQ